MKVLYGKSLIEKVIPIWALKKMLEEFNKICRQRHIWGREKVNEKNTSN